MLKLALGHSSQSLTLAYGGLVFSQGGVTQANTRLKEWLGMAVEKGKEAAPGLLEKAQETGKDIEKRVNQELEEQ